MLPRRPLILIAALSLLAGAAALRADSVRWVAAGTDSHPAGQTVPLTPALAQAVRDAIASTQPATPPSPGVPATQPTTVPTSQPTPPAVPLTLVGKGKAGLVADGKGKDLRLSNLWVRADARDPTAPGFQLANSDQAGPDLLTVRNAASATIQDVTLERGGQNLVVQNIAGDVTLRRVRSLDAWATNKSGMFRGQTDYAELIRGTLTIDQCLFDRGGWQQGVPAHELDVYGHDSYLQRGSGPARITGTAFMRASNAGAMLRSGGSVASSLIVDCGTGIIAMGRGDTVEVSDTLIVGGHRYWTGSAWTGNTAVMSYAKLLRLRNVWIVAVPGQANADPAAIAAGEKSYNTGCIALSSTYTAQHPDWPDPNPKLECVNVHVYGWPGSLVTLNNKPIASPGLTLHQNPVNVDVAGIVQRIRSGKTSVAAAILEVKTAAGAN